LFNAAVDSFAILLDNLSELVNRRQRGQAADTSRRLVVGEISQVRGQRIGEVLV
jgi:hypothetical protein